MRQLPERLFLVFLLLLSLPVFEAGSCRYTEGCFEWYNNQKSDDRIFLLFSDIEEECEEEKEKKKDAESSCFYLPRLNFSCNEIFRVHLHNACRNKKYDISSASGKEILKKICLWRI